MEADRKNSGKPAAGPKAPRPAFEAFAWHSDDRAQLDWDASGRSARNFAEQVHDVASGAKLIMQILEKDALTELADEETLRPTLNAQDKASLQRFAIVALDLLAQEAMAKADHLDGLKTRVQQPRPGTNSVQ